MLLDAPYVITVHDHILLLEGGLSGFGQAGIGGVEAVLARVENHAYYAGLDDVFGIAACTRSPSHVDMCSTMETSAQPSYARSLSWTWRVTTCRPDLRSKSSWSK